MSADNESPGIKITLAILAAAGAIAAAALTFLSNKYSVDRPIIATQTAEARRAAQVITVIVATNPAPLTPAATPAPTSAPVPTETPVIPATDAPSPEPTEHPYFTVVNRLGRPAAILIDDRRLGEIAEFDARDFLFDSLPATVQFRVRRPLAPDGAGLGLQLSGSWTDPADPGDRLILDNRVGESVYFYLVLTNATDEACRVTINRGLDDEDALDTPLPAATERVEYGYYELNPYSTVYLTCGDAEWYWGQKNADDDGRPLAGQLGEDSGELWLVLEP
jgi:hypothetical protein